MIVSEATAKTRILLLISQRTRLDLSFGSSNMSLDVGRTPKEAVEDGAIVPVDEDAARKLMKYMPWWVQVPESEKG